MGCFLNNYGHKMVLNLTSEFLTLGGLLNTTIGSSLNHVLCW